MNTLFNLIVVVQVLSALVIIGLVLLQHGKGADMGAAFGSGASGSLFGATGSSNFLSKSTAVAAAVFFASTLGLAYFGNNRAAPSINGGVMERVTTPSTRAPATTAPANNAGANVPATAPAAPNAPTAAPTAPAVNDVPAAPANQVPK
jgi:preprotein translocase subunit SecG